MSGFPRDELNGTGHIFQWRDGWAMTLGRARWYDSVVLCCDGHPSAEEAKNHGIARLVEISAGVADADIALWATQEPTP